MRKKHRSLIVFAVMVMAAFSLTYGCRDSRPPRIAVGGQVTYGGKPLAGGTVCFTRIGQAGGDKGISRPATGETDPNGQYVMRTFDKDDGVLPGEYAVTVMALDYAHGDIKGMPLLIPMKYNATQTSGLKATVPMDAGGPLRFDFDLH